VKYASLASLASLGLDRNTPLFFWVLGRECLRFRRDQVEEVDLSR
jgi:hypothetical protein